MLETGRDSDGLDMLGTEFAAQRKGHNEDAQ